MNLKREGCLLQSTESGQIGWLSGLWFLLFLWIMLCALLQTEIFCASAQYMEDALAASNLAAALIDVEEYGISHRLRIESPQESFERYRQALQVNLGLDAGWECGNKALVSGPVHIENFTVYNVAGSQVEAYSFDGSGTALHQQGNLGQMRAPNGIQVENTGIYSEISYYVQGMFGMRVLARKGKLVDLARNEGG